MPGFHAGLEKDRAATKAFMVNSGVTRRHAELVLVSKFKMRRFPCRLQTLRRHWREMGGVDRSIERDIEKSEREVLAGIREEHWVLGLPVG
jgi:hypothetical protein